MTRSTGCRIGPTLAVFGTLFLGATHPSAGFAATPARDVWFEPLDNLTPTTSGYIDADFPDLFAGAGSWAAGISTFSVNSVYSVLASDSQLQAMGAFLASHRIALNVVLPMLVTSGNTAVEGYARPGECWYIAYRFKSLGIQVASFSADEPLTWGRYFTGENSEQLSLADAAKAFATGIGEVRQSFPKAPIIDFEAPSLTTDAQWTADLPAWLAAVKKDSGVAVSTLVFDVDWSADWPATVKASLPALASAKTKAGIFVVDNDPNEATAEGWTATAEANEAAVEASGISFATKILANWTGAPTTLLPQTGPYPITALLPELVASQKR